MSETGMCPRSLRDLHNPGEVSAWACVKYNIQNNNSQASWQPGLFRRLSVMRGVIFSRSQSCLGAKSHKMRSFCAISASCRAVWRIKTPPVQYKAGQNLKKRGAPESNRSMFWFGLCSSGLTQLQAQMLGLGDIQAVTLK